MKRERLILILAILLLFLSASYFVRGLVYRTPRTEMTVREQAQVPETSEDESAGKPGDYSVLIGKNIFHPERRYQEKPPESVAPPMAVLPPPVMPQLVLKGIVQGADGEFIAYLSIDGKKSQPVHAGDRVDDLKVVSITMTDVTMKWFETDVRLSLIKVKPVGNKR